MLIALFPIFIIIALFIKFDSEGPIIFSQKRLGKNMREFNILKFRTMIPNAEFVGTGLNSFSNDSRVTKVGKFLRDSSLDELPQLINILLGKMSFVGPRPPVSYHPFAPDKYPEHAKSRFEVRPGVTGWAQINGRNELNWDEKFRYDSYYVENLGLKIDIIIFIKTIFKVLKREGGYDIERNRSRDE
jgi:lipopolysaccharide/colanic/teichoic acid biosynthesis glycosyltransferase